MAQKTSGLHAFLGKAWFDDLFQDIAGAKKFRRTYVDEFIATQGSERILDIGCGTAAILDFLPESVEYVGYDASSEYIDAASAKYGNRGKFVCQIVDNMVASELSAFDVVMANGLIHHLSDAETGNLAAIGASVLRRGGRFITHDPCYCDEQTRIAKYIIGRDRGQNVRNATQYLELLRPHFADVQITLCHNMAKIPYTHAIMVATK